MKKLLMVLAFAGASVAGFAQNDVPTEKYSVATNSFWSNWFIQVGAEWNAWYSGQEHGLDLDRSPLKSFRAKPGVGVALGKWFTPGIGLRTKFQGVWGKRVGDVNWNRFEGDVDGYDQYFGNRGWDSHDNNVYAEIGLNFNLGKATWDKVPDIEAINAQHQSALDALNARLRDAEAENARLRDELANQKPVETINESVKELINTPISVFFNLNKTNIASQKDLVNVQALAKYAVDNNNNLLVTGYADSATGKADHNQWLSEERAKTVAGELEKMGVQSSKITTVGKGGVDILSPISFNRRATVQITD